MPFMALLDDVRSRLRQRALDRGISPRDVDLLLSDSIGEPLSYVIAHGEREVDPAPIEQLLERRLNGEPLQYIRRRTEFFSHEFYVDERVLIPRPETEVLVEAALARARQGGRVLDIGTGSGCIAISLERTRPDLRVVATDRSLAALAVAQRNAHSVQSDVTLVASDLFSAIDGEFAMVVSNPPYVAEEEVEQLAIEVRGHEPSSALTPGRKGTEIIERLIEESPRYLSARGSLLMEFGYGQETAIRDIVSRSAFNLEAFLPDLAGIPRVVVLSRRS